LNADLPRDYSGHPGRNRLRIATHLDLTTIPTAALTFRNPSNSLTGILEDFENANRMMAVRHGAWPSVAEKWRWK